MTDTGIFTTSAKTVASRKYYVGDTFFYDVGIALSEAKTGVAVVATLHNKSGTQIGSTLVDTTHDFADTSTVLLSTINASTVPSYDTTGRAPDTYYIMVSISHADIEDETTGKLLGFELETEVWDTTEHNILSYAEAGHTTLKTSFNTGQIVYVRTFLKPSKNTTDAGLTIAVYTSAGVLVSTLYDDLKRLYANTREETNTTWTPSAVGTYYILFTVTGGAPSLQSGPQYTYEIIEVTTDVAPPTLTASTDKTAYTTAEAVILTATTDRAIDRVVAKLGNMWASLSSTDGTAWSGSIRASNITEGTHTPTWYALDDTNEVLATETTTDITVTRSTKWAETNEAISDEIESILKASTYTYLDKLSATDIYVGFKGFQDVKQGKQKIMILQAETPERDDSVASSITDYAYEITAFTRTFGKEIQSAQQSLIRLAGDIIDELQLNRTLNGTCDHLAHKMFSPFFTFGSDEEVWPSITILVEARARRLLT